MRKNTTDKIPTRGMTLRYIFALGLVACLSTAACLMLCRVIVLQGSSAAVINMSGKLRMLSQRAAVYSHLLVDSTENHEREKYRFELLHIAERMEGYLDGLIQGNHKLNLPGNPSPAIQALYFDPPIFLDRQIRNFISEIRATASTQDIDSDNVHSRSILDESASSLIESLDILVRQYQRESEVNSIRLRRMEIGVLGLTLSVLALEAFFVFRPMVARVKRDTIRLMNSEMRTSSVIEHAMDGIITLDKHGDIESFNPAAEKMFGYTCAEVRGKNIRTLMPEFYYNHLYEYLRTGRGGGPDFKIHETSGWRKGDIAFPIDISLSGLHFGDQQLFIMILRDTTGQKQAIKVLQKQHSFISTVLGTAGALVVVLDTAGKIVYFNRTCERITGYSFDEVRGRCFWELFLVPEEMDKVKAVFEKLKGKGFQSENVNYWVTKYGERRLIEWSNTTLLNNDSVEYIIGTGIDITERSKAEERLRKLSHAVEQSPSSIIITDNKGNIEYVNAKFTRLTGYTPEEVIGKNPRLLKSGDTLPEEYNRLWEMIISGEEWRGEFHNKKKNGESYWEYASISPIRNPKGTITHFIAIKEDITERKQFESQLEFLACHDPLTNLFNRRRFQEELEGCLAYAERYNNNGALLFLDIDNFKYVNDTLGHSEGDKLLIALADLIRQRLRETDVLARIGGDEFALFLPNITMEDACSVAEQVRKSVQQNVAAVNNQFAGITVSIGIALFPEHGNTMKTLLTSADLAMYYAKENGRNRICVYSPDQKTKIELRLSWEEQIRDALRQDRFTLYLQPILDLNTNSIAGYEALLRMINKDGKIIMPGSFLDIAEQFGLIRDIDRWVIRQAIQIIAKRRFPENNWSLEVNLSGMVFNDTEILSLIKQELSRYAIDPRALVFEITETAIIPNIVKAQHYITTLKSLGCRFALDDFGSGFSSFYYLKHLPVDYIKIDGSFIHNLPNDKVDQHMVRAIVEVARGLGKETVAEFVSDEQTVQILRDYGVDYAQGYYIGVPAEMPVIPAGIEAEEDNSLMVRDYL